MGGSLGKEKELSSANLQEELRHDSKVGGDEAREADSSKRNKYEEDERSHQTKALRHRLKKKAMASCAELHGDLLDCFQKASVFTFKPICQDENNAFWECYKKERGVRVFGGEREMSFRQTYEDIKVAMESLFTSSDDSKSDH